MGANSAISWTHHTFNAWWGCTKVSRACDHCYAESWSKRTSSIPIWGSAAPRRFFGEDYWREPLKWNAAAAAKGERKRVFCSSMSDVFEILHKGHEQRAEMDMARSKLWSLIEATPNLDWLLLTKRPHSVMRLVPMAWEAQFPRNVWVGTTIEDIDSLKKRADHLQEIPAVVKFWSCEPLLEDISPLINKLLAPFYKTNWIIAGGESGPGARAMHPQWARNLRDAAKNGLIPFHFKQWGDWVAEDQSPEDIVLPSSSTLFWGEKGPSVYRVGKKRAGRLLDGRTWDEFPEVAL